MCDEPRQDLFGSQPTSIDARRGATLYSKKLGRSQRLKIGRSESSTEEDLIFGLQNNCELYWMPVVEKFHSVLHKLRGPRRYSAFTGQETATFFSLPWYVSVSSAFPLSGERQNFSDCGTL